MNGVSLHEKQSGSHANISTHLWATGTSELYGYSNAKWKQAYFDMNSQ